MKKKLLLMLSLSIMVICLFAICVSAESAYVNAKGEQVEAGSADIAYELEFSNTWETGGNCRLTYIYLYDTSITKIVIPEIKMTRSNGVVYEMANYSYVRLSTGWGNTLSVYAIDDKGTKSNSLHTQIKELEFHIPTYLDGAGSAGNLAGWSGLEKMSFFKRAYEPQDKGGAINGCASLREIHFYGQDNVITANFFPNNNVESGLVVFHENATGEFYKNQPLQNINKPNWTVYLNMNITHANTADPRITHAKNGINIYMLVPDKSIYTEEQIASYLTPFKAGKNSSSNDYYSVPIMTYCEYYGEHRNVTEVSPCASKCLDCQLVTPAQSPAHNMQTTIEYTSFVLDGTKITKCLNDSCPLNTEPTVVVVDPLLTCLGYSMSNIAEGSIVLGFRANDVAISEYESVMGNTVAYGLFVVAKNMLGENDIFDAEGKEAAGVVYADTSIHPNAVFEMKVTGFATDNQKTAEFAIGAYVAVAKDGATKYFYEQTGTALEGEKYYFTTFNEIASLLENK